MATIQGGLLTNIKAWMEVGSNIQRNATGPGYPSTYASAECPGLDHEDILEMLLWEHIDKGSSGGDVPIQNPVSGIEDPHLDANGLPMDHFQRADAVSGSKKETPGIADQLLATTPALPR
jgi:hypothetical protein